MKIRLTKVAWLVPFVLLSVGPLDGLAAEPQDTIRVGILHSTTGTMAISEGVLRDTVLMLIEEQNARGGLLGRQLEPVIYDPRSNWGLYAQQARRMIEQDGVAAIFGCWTSASRKAVLPIVEELDSLLFYPVQYEGEESSTSIIYTGATPNQQAIPAVDYLRQQGVERWILAGTDYVYPRTTNRILVGYLTSLGVAEDDILLHYTPFGFADWTQPIERFSRFASAGKKTAVISTINGDSNLEFYAKLAARGITADQMPVMAFSVGEQELASLDPVYLAGHYATWGYFMSIDSPANKDFTSRWRRHTGNRKAVTNDPMEAHLLGFKLWVRAVELAGTVEPKLVRQKLVGLEEENLGGVKVRVRDNNHIDKQALIGRITADGTFIQVKASSAIVAKPWLEFDRSPATTQ